MYSKYITIVCGAPLSCGGAARQVCEWPPHKNVPPSYCKRYFCFIRESGVVEGSLYGSLNGQIKFTYLTH
jgi:hypothetical protein